MHFSSRLSIILNESDSTESDSGEDSSENDVIFSAEEEDEDDVIQTEG